MPNKRTIHIKQDETKRALAIYTHLNQIFKTIITDTGKITRPIDMSQSDILIASNSLRCLLFETPPTPPALLSFCTDYGISPSLFYIETDINLLFLSYFYPDELHVSDFLTEIILHPETRKKFKEDQDQQVLITFQDIKPFKGLLKNSDLWAPTIEECNRLNISVAPYPNPTQLINISLKKSGLQDFTNSRIGYLKAIPIPTRRMVGYVANTLGGVHYNSRHKPPTTKDSQAIRKLMTCFDWDHQSIMHTGFIVVALTCLQLFSSPEIFHLMKELETMLRRRQERLLQQS